MLFIKRFYWRVHCIFFQNWQPPESYLYGRAVLQNLLRESRGSSSLDSYTYKVISWAVDAQMSSFTNDISFLQVLFFVEQEGFEQFFVVNLKSGLKIQQNFARSE